MRLTYNIYTKGYRKGFDRYGKFYSQGYDNGYENYVKCYGENRFFKKTTTQSTRKAFGKGYDKSYDVSCSRESLVSPWLPSGKRTIDFCARGVPPPRIPMDGDWRRALNREGAETVGPSGNTLGW